MAKISWFIIFFAVLIWSAVYPHDYFTWFLEVIPALLGFMVLLLTRNSFPLTPLVYTLILIHCIVLMVGGHYTYAEVPLFDWIKEALNLERNNYDKVGHFVQGFVPAMIARELLIRNRVINGHYWLFFIVICFTLAFSAFYELIEWWVALYSGEDADAFLGTQGDVWDTQSDMGVALIGAIIALSFFSRWHNQQLMRYI